MTQSDTSKKPIQADYHGDAFTFKEFMPTAEPVQVKGSKLNRELIRVVELDLGATCNLDCPLCHRNWEDAQHLISGTNQRPVEEVIAQLETFPNLETITIAGVISEPTLYKDLFKLMEYIVSRNVLFYLYTNGDTHNSKPDYWKRMGELCGEKTLVYFTICGSTQEIHERYRVGSKLDNILKNHQLFRSTMKYNNDVLQYLIFEYNKEDYENNMDEIRSLFSRESTIGSLAYAERFKMVNKVDPDIRMAGDLSKKYETITKVSIKRFQNKSNCSMDCSSFNRRFVSIDNTGKMFPCYMHRVYNHDMDWDFDYSRILKAEYDFCHECENFTSKIINNTDGLLRIVEC